jgi:D-alanine--poly(phosphoribitol) ligase subunit 1
MQNNLIYHILKKNTQKSPSSIAFEFEDVSVTYNKFFNDCINFSNYINHNNFKTIGIIGDYNYLSYVSIFGTLISGQTYVPINNNLPDQKIRKIISSSKIDLISVSKLSLSRFLKFNIKKLNVKSLFKENYPVKKSKNSKTAYIIFTSGSTGDPKGVPITRKNLYHYINWLIKNFVVKKGSRCSQFPNIGFDLSVVDIFSTICGGGTLVVPNNIFYKTFPAKFIQQNKITHTVFVPSYVDLMLNSRQLNKNFLGSLKQVFFCGEPLYENQIKKLFNLNKELKIINSYGPTEATVSCTKLLLNQKNYKKFCNDSVSIGKSIPGMKIKLLEHKNLENKIHEILISGNQVFNGYLGSKKLNKNKFLKINNTKYFKTGDLVEKINKNIYFKRRLDTQIKIKGYRVELNEIDTTIRKFGIQQTKTIYKNLKLISFVVTKKTKVSSLNTYLKSALPSYMIPNSIIILKFFPKNINDKIDIKELIKKIRN